MTVNDISNAFRQVYVESVVRQLHADGAVIESVRVSFMDRGMLVEFEAPFQISNLRAGSSGLTIDLLGAGTLKSMRS